MNGLYQAHLEGVSRSFALSIPQLAEPMRNRVALAYLLCRLLDTVEDAPWPTRRAQAASYAGLDLLAREAACGRAPRPEAARAWCKDLPGGLSEQEQRLAADAPMLFADLAALAGDARALIAHTVRQMGAGMAHFSARRRVGGSDTVLRDLADVNRYCYFVAGTVGQLLTRLFALDWPHFSTPLSLTKKALHFGLFLQKVNILKDQADDERAGRFFVPDRQRLIASSVANAEGALAYLLALPRAAVGYRTFCAWALFLGAACLPLFAASAGDKAAARLPRARTLALLGEVAAGIDDDLAMGRRLEAALREVRDIGPAGEPRLAPGAEVRWFADRVATCPICPLDRAALAELNMV